MATSGTVGTTTISCAQILDHAFRRCKLVPQLVTNEHIDTAKRILWLNLTMLANRGITLWVIDTQLIGLTYGQHDIVMPAGGIALLNSNLRNIQRISGSAFSSAGGSSGNAYDQDLTTPCTQTSPNGYIQITFDAQPSALTQVGILPAASGTWNFSLQWSDGFTWTTITTVTTAVTAGQWLWYDVDGVPAAEAMRIQASGGTTLNVYEVMCGNTPSDIPMSPMDRDTWTQLPNKSFTGRPVQYYWDRRINAPIMHIWPAPGSGYQLTYLLVNYVQRQLQDVGTLSQNIELPDRWYLPMIADLARNLAREIKEVDPSILPDLDQEATRLVAQGWDNETSGGTARFIPNISGYTR